MAKLGGTDMLKFDIHVAFNPYPADIVSQKLFDSICT